MHDAAFGAATDAIAKYVSPVNPAARWTGADGGAAYFAYSTNYPVDLDNAVIVDVEPTAPIRPAEARAARDMIDRVEARFGIKPGKLVGDTGYGSAEMPGWLVEDRKIAPHIPVRDKSKRTGGTFSREDFAYLVRAIWRSQFVSFLGNIAGAAAFALAIAFLFLLSAVASAFATSTAMPSELTNGTCDRLSTNVRSPAAIRSSSRPIIAC